MCWTYSKRPWSGQIRFHKMENCLNKNRVQGILDWWEEAMQGPRCTCVYVTVWPKKKKKSDLLEKGGRPKGGAMELNGWELKHSKGCSIATNTKLFQEKSSASGNQENSLFLVVVPTGKERQSLHRWGRGVCCFACEMDNFLSSSISHCCRNIALVWGYTVSCSSFIFILFRAINTFFHLWEVFLK